MKQRQDLILKNWIFCFVKKKKIAFCIIRIIFIIFILWLIIYMRIVLLNVHLLQLFLSLFFMAKRLFYIPFFFVVLQNNILWYKKYAIISVLSYVWICSLLHLISNNRYNNVFKIHRCIGWKAILLLWFFKTIRRDNIDNNFRNLL